VKRKVQLPEQLIKKLSNLPEQGMGYQVVRITLKNGIILNDRRVLNSSFLLMDENENITTDQIKDAEIS